MSLLWLRATAVERQYSSSERRVRDFLDTRAGVSESVRSLSSKLGVSRGSCRHALERLVQEGVVRRLDFSDMEPLYTRFPGR
jgi:hypothetical protein